MSDAEGLERFPCEYMFKIFGRRSDTFVTRVCAIVSDTLGVLPADAVRVRESSAGRHVCVTIVWRVDSRAQLERVYADLTAEREVLFCL